MNNLVAGLIGGLLITGMCLITFFFGVSVGMVYGVNKQKEKENSTNQEFYKENE